MTTWAELEDCNDPKGAVNQAHSKPPPALLIRTPAPEIAHKDRENTLFCTESAP